MNAAELNEEAAKYLTSIYSEAEYGYSATQVDTKLRRMRRESGSNRGVPPNSGQIHEEGSTEISWVNEERRERITRRTNEITNQKQIEFIYSPRKTRSASQALNRSTASPTRLSSTSASLTITVQSNKRTKSTRSSLTREMYPTPGDNAVRMVSFFTSIANLTAK